MSNLISKELFDQIKWERDIAIGQLKELGYGLGEKIRTDKDTISRRAAIDLAHKNYDTILDFKSDGRTVADSFEDIINTLPSVQPEQRWIPVSEGLPNGREEVIVSCHDDSGDTPFDYSTSGWVTTDGKYWVVDNDINNFVTAWMPLPEPYKEDKRYDQRRSN